MSQWLLAARKLEYSTSLLTASVKVYTSVQSITLLHVWWEIVPGVCADDTGRLQQVLECAQRHIHSSSQLFKLAQDAFKIATPSDGPKCMSVLSAAFELGLQVREHIVLIHETLLQKWSIIVVNWYFFKPAFGFVVWHISTMSATHSLNSCLCLCAGDANDTDDPELASAGDGAMACHMCHWAGSSCSHHHHAQVVPVLRAHWSHQ